MKKKNHINFDDFKGERTVSTEIASLGMAVTQMEARQMWFVSAAIFWDMQGEDEFSLKMVEGMRINAATTAEQMLMIEKKLHELIEEADEPRPSKS